MTSQRESETASRAVLTGPIVPTFFYYAIPSTIGLLALTTSNLVDGVFVGNYVGAEALAAITLLIPVFTVLFAVALMFAIGGSVASGKHIGEGNVPSASVVFSQSLVATAAAASVFALASLVLEGQLYHLLNVPPELAPLVSDYFGVIRWVFILQLTTMVLYYFVRADGHPILATTSLVVGALGNVALDALFVIHFEMGLAGAAYAVAVSQVAQAGFLCRYFWSKERTLEFVLRHGSWRPLWQATYNGVSEFINEISSGVILWLLNLLLLVRLGVDGVAAYSVVSYYIFLSLMLTYGVADALHLLASQNFGARNHGRIRQFLSTAVACSLCLGVCLAVSLLVFGEALTGWFVGAQDARVAEDAMALAWVVWPLFLVNGTNLILSCYLTAVHEPRPSVIVASLRGLVLPAVLLVTLYFLFERWTVGGSLSEWMFLSALPLAEWLTFGVALILCYRYRPSVLNRGGPRHELTVNPGEG